MIITIGRLGSDFTNDDHSNSSSGSGGGSGSVETRYDPSMYVLMEVSSSSTPDGMQIDRWVNQFISKLTCSNHLYVL